MTASPLRCVPLAAILLLASSAMATAAPHGGVQVGHPWMRPTPPSAPTAAGYLALTNNGRSGDRLMGAASSSARAVELHVMSMAGGVMRMRPIAGGLDLPPGRTVALAPGGVHLMFVAPKRALKLGEHVPAVLRFQHAGPVAVTFTVEQPPPAGMEMR